MMRPYAGESDLKRLAHFLIRARAAAGPCRFYHLGDLYWNLFLAELRGEIPENLALWDGPGGELLGFAWFYPPDVVDVQAAPWLPDAGALEREMLAWALERRRRFPSAGEVPQLLTDAFEDDRRRIALLEGLGFRREAGYKQHLEWNLNAPVPAQRLPEGLAVRPFTDDEIPARVAVHRSVWPRSRVTPENYHCLRALSGYDPELDLVCVAPDGSFVGFAVAWLDRENRCGEFEPVGTDPEHRGRGIARALLLEGLRRFQAWGAVTALVYPAGGDAPAERAYAAAGFTPVNRQWVYGRELSPGASPPSSQS